MEEETKTTETAPETPAEKTYSEEDYNALKAQLDEANKTIQGFKDMDIESIQKSADDWKQKAEALEQAQKERDYSDKLDKFVAPEYEKRNLCFSPERLAQRCRIEIRQRRLFNRRCRHRPEIENFLP